jgi:hypothetical protein
MFFGTIQIDVEPRIFSSLQDKYIEFDCQMLTNIFCIFNKGPRVFEIKIIPTIKGFMYNETIACTLVQWTLHQVLRLRAKIYSHNLRLSTES